MIDATRQDQETHADRTATAVGSEQVDGGLSGKKEGLLVRKLAGVLMVGSLIGVAYGLFGGLGDLLQVGGAQGFVFRGWQAVIIGIVLFLGSSTLLVSVDGPPPARRSMPGIVVGVAMMLIAGLLYLTWAKSADDYCVGGDLEQCILVDR